MCIVIYICFFSVNRTIVIKSDKLIYKLLTRKVRINYKNIIMIDILKREGVNNNSYSLIISEKYRYQISDIQKYKQTDIEFFIDMIGIKDQSIYLMSDKLKDMLNEVWLNCRNCK